MSTGYSIQRNWLTIGLFLFLFSACKKAEDIKVNRLKPEVELIGWQLNLVNGHPTRGERLKTAHLSKDTVYLIKEDFTREAGEQLIIDPGVLIKVTAPPPGSNFGPSVIINPGGTISALGTAAEPVVFTANDRAGTQGNNWEGIVINGKSYNNSNGNEGIPDDFSGVIQYTRIEFASIALVGVGNKTVLDHIMVSYTNKLTYSQYQSAFNFYGGTFNARNLISYACGGPTDFFITNGYSGFMQDMLVSRHPFFGRTGGTPANTLTGVFIQNNDNNNPAPMPYTNPVISNLTVAGPDNQSGMPLAYRDTTLLSAALVTTNSACFHIRNSLLLAFPAACWILNDNATAANLTQGNGELSYSGVHSNDTGRIFYLAPNSFDPYTTDDFRNYMLSDLFKNRVFENSGDFKFENISSYETGPDFTPKPGSPVLTGANYDSSVLYNNVFFDKSEKQLGAIGAVNWLQNWTNFTPLKTNYNFPQ